MPAGKGFADLVFVPDRKCSTPAMVVELKWNHSVQTAIDQIRSQNYVACLEHYSGDILLVGVNYDKESKEHTCKIERVNKQVYDTALSERRCADSGSCGHGKEKPTVETEIEENK